MTTTIDQLLNQMQVFCDDLTSGPAEEEDAAKLDGALGATFGADIGAIGPEHLICTLFQTNSGSLLGVRLTMLRFVWKDFDYDAWLRILNALEGNRGAVFEFLRFASESLSLDIAQLAPVHETVREVLERVEFRDGGPPPYSAEVRKMLDDDFDYEALWARLAADGAPIRAGDA